jgi:hypothetical protein
MRYTALKHKGPPIMGHRSTGTVPVVRPVPIECARRSGAMVWRMRQNCAKIAFLSKRQKKSVAHSIGTWTNISDANSYPNPNTRISTPFWHWTYPPLAIFFCAQTVVQGVQRGLAPKLWRKGSKGDLRQNLAQGFAPKHCATAPGASIGTTLKDTYKSLP